MHADLLLKMTADIEGIPEPKVQFYKDGKEIKQSERVKIVKEGEKHTLVVEKTTLTDTGRLHPSSFRIILTTRIRISRKFAFCL